MHTQRGAFSIDHSIAMTQTNPTMTNLRIDPTCCDGIASVRPATTPPKFEVPTFRYGLRTDTVVVYCEHRRTHIEAKNVLIQDYSTAYWPIPDKKTIRTIMGHVEICQVLTRSSDDDDEEDGEIVFLLTTEMVAVKVYFYNKMSEYQGRLAENPWNEISAMQLIGNEHPHVMGIIESIVTDDGNFNVVMPYSESGDLYDKLQKPISEAEAKYWFRQLVKGIQHLHQKRICHRDLSLENVVIHQNTLKIIDMGLAIRVPYNGTERLLIERQGRYGKLSYMSPEIYQNRAPFDGDAVDVWGAGTILFCLVTGNKAYGIPHPTDAYFCAVTSRLANLLDSWGVDLSSSCIDLLQKMLRIDPQSRLTIEEILDHPWLAHDDSARVGMFG